MSPPAAALRSTSTGGRWLPAILVAAGILSSGCGGSGSPVSPTVAELLKLSGEAQVAPPSSTLQPYQVKVVDAGGGAVVGAVVTWRVTCGGGSVTPDSAITDSRGIASAVATLPAISGAQTVTASSSSLAPITFSSRAGAPAAFSVLSGGNNVRERYSSDLSVANDYAYTGTWNWIQRATGVAGAIKVFHLGAGGAPTLVDSVRLNSVITVSDLEVSPDGSWLVATAEGGTGGGLYVYSLADPAAPLLTAHAPVATGLHTGSLAVINGTLYAFGAKDPGSCALMIFDLSAAGAGTITTASSTPIPDNYCIHDTYVRDGYAFVFAWDEGLYIFDVGNGSHGGTPAAPVRLSKTGSVSSPAFGGETHNGWWFWNPVTSEKRYLFIGQEGPGAVGASSSGDIHVVDVSNLAAPAEVGFFHIPGAGTHNFWLDEPNQRLYAAYYNAGVVAVDISCTLSGDLGYREIARTQPGGSGNTYTWGVQLYNGSLYAIDMLSGLWQLGLP